MAHAMQQPKFISPIKFKTFSKYDFVESFVAATKDEKIKAEEKIKAAIIADAIEETQAVLLENLVTKDDLKKDIEQLKSDLTIRLTVIMTGLFTLLPLVTDFIRHLFKF
jgi:hypothetical protein